jgi:hypothetical protein
MHSGANRVRILTPRTAAAGVKFIRTATREPFGGRVAIVLDLDGN